MYCLPSLVTVLIITLLNPVFIFVSIPYLCTLSRTFPTLLLRQVKEPEKGIAGGELDTLSKTRRARK